MLYLGFVFCYLSHVQNYNKVGSSSYWISKLANSSVLLVQWFIVKPRKIFKLRRIKVWGKGPLNILSPTGGNWPPGRGGNLWPLLWVPFFMPSFQIAWNWLKIGGHLLDKIKITYQTIEFWFGALKPPLWPHFCYYADNEWIFMKFCMHLIWTCINKIVTSNFHFGAI